MKRFYFLALISLFFISSLAAMETSLPTGKKLSDFVFKTCEQEKLNPEINYLTNNHTNDFPYNIIVKISKDNNLQEPKYFVIQVSQSDIFYNPAIVSSLANSIYQSGNTIPILLFFSFESQFNLPDINPTEGLEAFIRNIESFETLEQAQIESALLLDFNSEKNLFFFGSRHKTANPNLIKGVYTAFSHNGLLQAFKPYFISHIFRSNIFDDNELSLFLDSDISAAKIIFSETTTNEVISTVLRDTLTEYSKGGNLGKDSHWVMVSTGQKEFWFSERSIVKSLILILFGTLLYIYLTFFINSNLQRKAWSQIKKIWHIPIIIFFVSLICFYLGKYFCIFIENVTGVKLNFFTRIQIILPFTFIVLSLIFTAVLYNSPDFQQRTIDYLIMISVTFNLYLFSFFDISLFSIFFFEFLLSLFCIVIQSNIAHTVLLPGYILPFIPYIRQINYCATPQILNNFINNSSFFPFALILICTPFFLIYFRIIAHLNIIWFDKDHNEMKMDIYNTIATIITILVLTIPLEIITPLKIKGFREHQNNSYKVRMLSKSEEPKINIYKEKIDIFGDRIVNLAIESEVSLAYCDLRLIAPQGQALMFSDFDYSTENSSTSVFKIPAEPPKDMIFSYGESSLENTIVLTAVYKDSDNPESYVMENISLLSQGF